MNFGEALDQFLKGEWCPNYSEQHQFVEGTIFVGLTNLNTGFDASQIFHFSPQDFVQVIDRCEDQHVRINGIEIFTTDIEPQGRAGLIEVEITPGELSARDRFQWARRLVNGYLNVPHITISATFSVPDSVLRSSGSIPKMNCSASGLLPTWMDTKRPNEHNTKNDNQGEQPGSQEEE